MASKKREEMVKAILHAPFGILLVIRCVEEVNKNRSLAFSSEEISTFALEDDDILYFDMLSSERLIELVVRCGSDLSPYMFDYRERVIALLACGPSLKLAAEHLLAAPGASDWFVNLDRKHQVWISRDGRPPTPTSSIPDLRPFSLEVPKPMRALWTSTSVGSFPSSWIPYLRKGEDGRLPPYHPWRLEVAPSTRVYEIHGPKAWYDLCITYPLVGSNNCLTPNWDDVAHDWDGVHLSMGGLLTTEQLYWNTPQGCTYLFSWSIESTVWLRWVFTQVERLPDVNE